MSVPKLRFLRMPGQYEVALPAYQTAGSVGMDLAAADYVEIAPRAIEQVRTGWAVEIPEGYEGQVRSRSGLSRRGVVVINSPGTIDADFRGEVCVLLINHGRLPYRIIPGDRIAQLVISPIVRLPTEEANELTETVRGTGGVGSTGR